MEKHKICVTNVQLVRGPKIEMDVFQLLSRVEKVDALGKKC
jgi:hypothetical protein